MQAFLLNLLILAFFTLIGAAFGHTLIGAIVGVTVLLVIHLTPDPKPRYDPYAGAKRSRRRK